MHFFYKKLINIVVKKDRLNDCKLISALREHQRQIDRANDTKFWQQQQEKRNRQMIESRKTCDKDFGKRKKCMMNL